VFTEYIVYRQATEERDRESRMEEERGNPNPSGWGRGRRVSVNENSEKQRTGNINREARPEYDSIVVDGPWAVH
jgi:hypothetical protein